MGGVILAVAPACGTQLQLEAVCRFTHFYATLRHFYCKRIFCFSAYQFHVLHSLGSEAVRVGLCGSRHTDRLYRLPVLPYAHDRWYHACIIDHVFKLKLLILAYRQRRCQVIGREDTTVFERVLRADKRRRTSSFEDVYVYTLAPQSQQLAHLVLCHKLHCVPSD